MPSLLGVVGYYLVELARVVTRSTSRFSFAYLPVVWGYLGKAVSQKMVPSRQGEAEVKASLQIAGPSP